jgi:transcriptional regulator with XRE-family HTH domain
MNIPSQRRVARAFGNVLVSCRRTAKISQEELAFRAGLDRTYPSLLERGLRQPTIGKFMAIGYALNVDPSTLMMMTLIKVWEDRS